METLYTIKTKVCGNPDFGQNPNKPPYGVRITTLKAKTFTELLKKVREWFVENDIGGGNWQQPALMCNGSLIGYMSYNGKIWATNTWPSTEIHMEVIA